VNAFDAALGSLRPAVVSSSNRPAVGAPGFPPLKRMSGRTPDSVQNTIIESYAGAQAPEGIAIHKRYTYERGTSIVNAKSPAHRPSQVPRQHRRHERLSQAPPRIGEPARASDPAPDLDALLFLGSNGRTWNERDAEPDRTQAPLKAASRDIAAAALSSGARKQSVWPGVIQYPLRKLAHSYVHLPSQRCAIPQDTTACNDSVQPHRVGTKGAYCGADPRSPCRAIYTRLSV